jgi:hypothetical protein
MKRRFNGGFFLFLAAFALLAFLSACRVSAKKAEPIKTIAVSDEEQAQAVQRMRTFLAEVDKDHGETWEQLSQVLKASTTQATWATVLSGMRTACGKNLSRGAMQGGCTEELPESPKGRYFLFDIPSKFERVNCTERVVLVLENSQWKVAGYFRSKSIALGDEAKKP